MARTRTVPSQAQSAPAAHKRVFSFGPGRVEGTRQMRDLLGAKGANLCHMTSIGLPVPPGFIISAEACAEYYKAGGKLPDGLMDEVRLHLAALEQTTGRRFGSPAKPLLVSVRSGAAVSMPGIMDTVLDVGANDAVCEGLASAIGDARFARDTYRRLVEMFGVVVMGVPAHRFRSCLDAVKRACGVDQDSQLGPYPMGEVLRQYKEIYQDHAGEPFPQDVDQQLQRAIAAVFQSWNAPRAARYRMIHEIAGLLGTAVTVQSMVYGNLGDSSASGVGFTRDPSTGRDELFGEFLINAQGEDVVSGLRPPLPLAKMRQWRPQLYRQLLSMKERLEKHWREMQDFEFTIERGRLYMLQTRTGKRAGAASVRIACDMVRQKIIDRQEAVLRVPPDDLRHLLLPSFAPDGERQPIATGLPASPGAAVGQPAFTPLEAVERSRAGEKVILVRRETGPEDVDGIWFAEGVVTVLGGMTSHAAVVARGWGKPAVTGCLGLEVDVARREFRVGGRVFGPGDAVSIDGSTGQIMAGALPARQPTIGGDFSRLLRWADGPRRLRIRANADTPAEARAARQLGAEGIGLCRSESLWFAEDRLVLIRRMILSDSAADRHDALERFLPLHRKDFIQIFTAMDGLPVTIRLLDPPLYDFLPREEKAQAELASRIGLSVQRVRARVAEFEENNPMLGLRGARLCVTYPQIMDMQVRAIVEAAIECRRARVDACPEIMLALIGTDREMRMVRAMVQKTIDETRRQQRFVPRLDIPIGAMIEVPRAAVTADRIADYADFFSFGTNDLTQMTFGYSRDDTGTFLPAYLAQEVLARDPFQSLDVEGVGRLMTMAVVRGRSSRPGLKCGICGPHGGDVSSIGFCHEIGLDYVSCRPLRLPVARLAAAQAALKGR